MTTPDPAAPVARRTVVLGGALASAGLVAACSTSSSTTTPTTAPAPETSSSAPTTSPTEASPSASPTGTVVGPVKDVPEGGGAFFEVAGQTLVVTQPSKGVYEGFSAVCPHEGCLCSEVTDKQVVCTCHMSTFAITDGSVTGGPARQGLAPVAVTVSGSDIVLA